MTLQRCKEHGDEALGADAIGGVPGELQRVLDLRSTPA